MCAYVGCPFRTRIQVETGSCSTGIKLYPNTSWKPSAEHQLRHRPCSEVGKWSPHRHMWQQKQNICNVNIKKRPFRAPKNSHLWRQDSFRLPTPDATINGHRITRTDRNLGVIFDGALSMDAHTKEVCRVSLFRLRNIAKIRKCLPVKVAEQLIHVLCRQTSANHFSMVFLQHLYHVFGEYRYRRPRILTRRF